MRRFLIAWFAVFITTTAIQGADSPPIHSEATLKWVDQNAPGTAAHFIVQIYLGEKVVASKRVDAAEVKVKDLLAKLIPGEYQLRIITVDQNGIASTPSAPLTIVWVGSGLG